MNVIELGAIGEMVGGAAVLITLIYLALQVRLGNELARGNASYQWTDFNFAMVGGVIGDRDLADVWMRAGSDFASLDPIDRQRMVFFEWRAIELWHHNFHQYERGILAKDQWEKTQAIFQGPIGERQSVREAWKVFRGTYDRDFQALLDGYLASSMDEATAEA